MGIVETIGEIIGKTVKSIMDSILSLLKFKPEQLSDIDTEIAAESLDPSKFKTKEVRELAQTIKDKLKHSPGGVAEWVQSIMGDFMVKVWDIAIGILIPEKMENFEDAKASATWLSFLFADFVVLAGILDAVGTAFSATLVRNLIHIFRLFAATFGMDRYLDACIAPALSSSLVPRLTQGYQEQYRTQLLDLNSIITAWRRDPEKYKLYLDDLKKQGFDDDRIEALKFATQAFPSLQDVIRFYAREVFEPDMIERYGLGSELPPYKGTLFEKLGVPSEVASMYWMAHWEHASWNQIVEMLHRGLLTEDDVYEWFRLVEIPPFWRDLLIKTAYTWPTRVDTRRFYALGTIDDARLREIYMGMGYREQNLEDYILWTKVYTKFPRLTKKWEAGQITIEDIKSTLLGWGMTNEGADELIANEIDVTEPEATTEGKNLTKTEVYKAVKEGEITFEEGVDLVMLLGYTRATAELLVETHT